MTHHKFTKLKKPSELKVATIRPLYPINHLDTISQWEDSFQ